MDDHAWREGVEGGESADELPDDVQSQSSAMGAAGAGGGLRELEVRHLQNPVTYVCSVGYLRPRTF